jgi:hypothetical protein
MESSGKKNIMEERKTQKYINVVSGKDGSQSEGRGLE